SRPPPAPPTRLSGEAVMQRIVVGAALALGLFSMEALAQDKKKPAVPPVAPTVAALPYGKHERQVLDFWKAKSDKPTPLVLYIQGGGGRGGAKSSVGAALRQSLDAGISVAAINYRYVQQAAEMKVEPPVKAPLEDAARALQFIRSKAGEWNLDKKRVGATGGAAGGRSAPWVGLHHRPARPPQHKPPAAGTTP